MNFKFALLVVALIAIAHVADAKAVNKPCKRRQTARVITRGFVRLYCYRRSLKQNVTPNKFIGWYFNKYQSKDGFLQRAAFRKYLRQSQSGDEKNLRKKLLGLRKRCVGQFKRWLGRKNNKVGRKEFRRYLRPFLRKKKICKKGFFNKFFNKYWPKFVKRYNKKYYGKKVKKSKKAKKVSKKSNKSAKKSKKQGSSKAIPYCPPGYYKKLAKSKRCFKRTARIIRRAFRRLYCHKKFKNRSLTPRRFLRRYFRFNKTKNNYLPRVALRRNLRRKLPKYLKKLRKRLVKLRTKCVKKFKRSLDTDKDFKVSKGEFVKYFRPYLKKRGLCRRYWNKYRKYYPKP